MSSASTHIRLIQFSSSALLLFTQLRGRAQPKSLSSPWRATRELWRSTLVKCTPALKLTSTIWSQPWSSVEKANGHTPSEIPIFPKFNLSVSQYHNARILLWSKHNRQYRYVQRTCINFVGYNSVAQRKRRRLINYNEQRGCEWFVSINLKLEQQAKSI